MDKKSASTRGRLRFESLPSTFFMADLYHLGLRTPLFDIDRFIRNVGFNAEGLW
ncbi:uncharacterized protein PHALS_11876 [Plasmopara halstedii]|uniref:Uncharacterized protein n=1 Tax=Plasmopara halstedii TaxID=4781 RepID=A0A0P1AK95_PLAHL|nr:uncharacterized protein PHALS_11876 [Plasmopara halstedii]CEG41536.1 hypothetical protein PHALS_11876 [Plasmopara halstedii]|eukprot:XP_024577905.1 hypothetical protein PHALS_11876 [Plasmopara halstedii]